MLTLDESKRAVPALRQAPRPRGWLFRMGEHALRCGALFVALSAAALSAGVARAQTNECGDTLYKIARPDGVDAASWGATDNLGAASPVTVNVWWTPTAGSSINIATFPGQAVLPVAQGGTALDLTPLLCSGQSGELGAKATSAAGIGSAVALKPVTFRRRATPPPAPVLLP